MSAILTFRLLGFSPSLRSRWMRMILLKGRVRLLMTNSRSRKISSVSTFSFFSSKVTGYRFCSWCGLGSRLPLERLASTFLTGLVLVISPSLLLSG